MEILDQCPKCGAKTFHRVWMSTIPQQCSNCGYKSGNFEILY